MGVAILGSIFAILFALNQEKFSGMYNVAYGILLIFIVLALVAILAFVVKKLIGDFKDDPKKAIRSLVMVGVIILVALVSFIFAKGDDVSQALLDKNNLSLGTSKFIGAACIMVYILCIAAVAAIVYVEASKALKKK